MNGYLIALAPAVAFAAALAYHSARGLGDRGRKLAWLGCSVAVGLSPCLIPLSARPLRLGASLLAVTFLVKFYDLHREPQLALRMGLPAYLAYLPNGFWLVRGREPSRVAVTTDLRRLVLAAPACLLSMLLGICLWSYDWSAVPFALEHVMKVFSVVVGVMCIANASAAAFRLAGGTALVPMRHPIAATTPAEFWRRWNRPAQQFLNEYAFKPAGGVCRAVRATLVTFGISGLVHEYVFGLAAGHIQGYQFLYFSLQGCAVAATMHARPVGPRSALWVAGTLVFNLFASVLFFRSVDAVVPFYWPRSP